MNYIDNLQESIEKHYNKNAFFIDDTFFTYKDLAIEISKIRITINQTLNTSEKLIGLIANDDIKTYAAIIAFWLEGKAYVPINPEHPQDRNETILKSLETNYIFDSTEKASFHGFTLLFPSKTNNENIDIKANSIKENDLAYILFTSGSTGTPKGVPITYNNLNAFIKAINFDGEFKLNSSDRCLQMFELTFDFSVVSYIFPLLEGACIYTVPRHSIKYFYIYKLIKVHQLTVLSLVPSIIHYLRPYFEEIKAPQVRYCSFGGGVLYNDIIQDWNKCIPNSKTFNYYGPTENTIYSSYYKLNKENKTHNGVISIGRPLNEVTYIIIDKNNKEVPIGKSGELALSSNQLTPGYWKNEQKNKASFFFKEYNEESLRFYKTGDLCFRDSENDYIYLGRIDFQVKIRGFRIELSEVEFHAKSKCVKKVNMVAIDILNDLGNAELALAIESEVFDTSEILENMKEKMPDYMIPAHIKFIKELPYNSNGKIDRNQLRTYLK
ncbi:AMP-binding protein [Flavivirga rizhaonensis]|uniref:AMP-dependent synthetase n=1 Tax=Flavivirga rizhaonensis TaxID=2559571 RepID=A0A4S1E0F1_9FLAO|nr:AMP-binding protein [Flavivirga rizhaonensis]TGV03929.1 AMP-dependent synthetase [Flavivirga rizhaonensis]